MEKESVVEREKEFLNLLLETEDLAEKKSRIYSRLLTEQTLADAMEKLSSRHTERKERLAELLYGKERKKQKNGEENDEA